MRWEAGELSAQTVAIVIAAEQVLEVRKKAQREKLSTLLFRIGEPLKVLGRVTRWVEPTTAESTNVKKTACVHQRAA